MDVEDVKQVRNVHGNAQTDVKLRDRCGPLTAHAAFDMGEDALGHLQPL